MSLVDLDDLHCKCDGKEGRGELDIKRMVYNCMRCGKEIGDDDE